jgi:hypothetical protein
MTAPAPHAEHVAAALAKAPPLRSEQGAKLAELLKPVRRAADRPQERR